MASSRRSKREGGREKRAAEEEEEAQAPAASSSRSARRVEEEDVGRGARASRGSSSGSSGGMGLAAKVGLLTALATLVIMALAVLPSSGGGDEAGEAAFLEAGYAVVNTLASVDASQWLGAGSGGELKRLRQNLEKLFGERSKTWFSEQEAEIKKLDPDADAEERAEQVKRAKKYEEAVETLEKGSGDTSLRSQNVLLRVAGESQAVGPFEILAAWVREGLPGQAGRFVAGSHAESTLALSGGTGAGNGKATWVPGSVGGHPARVFMQKTAGTTHVTAYVALRRSSTTSSGGGLGLLLLALGPIVVGFVGYAVASRHAAQLHSLARELEKVGTAGDPTRAVRAQGAEAMAVARAVERMVGHLEFRKQQGGTAGMADMDALVERERKLAGEIHEGLINKHPPRLSDYEVEHLFKPGFEVGGDHFEYFRIDDDHLGVILLDTNVRGIPAALVMSSARSYVRAAAPGNLSPADVLKQVNRHLAGELPPGRHVTAVYVVIDTAQGKATMASAGHLPVLVFRQATGKIAKVNPAGIAMGLDVGPVFDRELQEGDVPLGPGDRLVLYTDGALRITNETGEEFGEQRFYGAVAREAPKNSQAFVNFVGSAIDQFHLQTPQDDDVTISTVKRLR